MAKNITCDPAPPHDMESKAKKMLEALLCGQHVNRKNCHSFGIADQNDSIHSVASNLRHKKQIPLITDRNNQDRGVATYYMDANEIKRYHAPDQREQQKYEMRYEIDIKRKSMIVKRIKKMLELEYQKTSPDINFLNELRQVINQT